METKEWGAPISGFSRVAAANIVTRGGVKRNPG